MDLNKNKTRVILYILFNLNLKYTEFVESGEF